MIDEILRALVQEARDQTEGLVENHAPDYASYMERVGRIRGLAIATGIIHAKLQASEED